MRIVLPIGESALFANNRVVQVTNANLDGGQDDINDLVCRAHDGRVTGFARSVYAHMPMRHGAASRDCE